MKQELIQEVLQGMQFALNNEQLQILQGVLGSVLSRYSLSLAENADGDEANNAMILKRFLDAKHLEGCSDKTINYYKSTVEKTLESIGKPIRAITTEDLRGYLAEYQGDDRISKVTLDNVRRILSSFFGWLEDEDFIVKSPIRRIHKVKTPNVVKTALNDEELEILRDSCDNLRDIALLDFLVSTGVRVGELVGLNKDDINFNERECIVFGKGDKERMVYFDARTKLHLEKYLESRDDDNPALFVSLHKPHNRLTRGGVESFMRKLGEKAEVKGIHPHKMRRTLATMAIDKGMPIEQVQALLGHARIDTTLKYAMVKQSNVKQSHKRYIS